MIDTAVRLEIEIGRTGELGKIRRVTEDHTKIAEVLPILRDWVGIPIKPVGERSSSNAYDYADTMWSAR